MNKAKLAQSFGQRLKIRPHVIQILVEHSFPPRFQGRRRRFLDDEWIVMKASREMLELWNLRVPYILKLPADSIREFRHSNFLILRSQVFIEDPDVWLEPLVERQRFAGAFSSQRLRTGL